MRSESLRILFVINNRSGRNKNSNWQSQIEDYFGKLPYEQHFFIMPPKNCEKQLTETVKKINPGLIVAVGGDGTVTLVAKQVLNTGMEMAIVPAGSANGMARELDIPEDPVKAFEVVLKGTVKETDVISINDNEICLHLSDIGLNAQLVKYFQEGRVRGFLGYSFALVKALNRHRKMRVAVHTRHEEVVREAYMVLIANASKYGTGAIINPQSSIYDGLFEVVIVRRLSILEVLKTFLHFRRFNPKNIEVLHARAVNIETNRKMHFQIDGEYLGKTKKVQAKVLEGKLKLIVPPEKEAE